VDTYGKWLPKGNPALADRLDDADSEPLENNVVAKAAESGSSPCRASRAAETPTVSISYLGLVDRGGIEPPTS